MKCLYRAFQGKLTIEVEGSNIKEIIEAIGDVAAILDSDTECGACKSPHIHPQARDAKKADGLMIKYYELACSDCGAQLPFGQHSQGGTLWAKRSDKEGEPLPNRGWRVYERRERDEYSPQPRQQASSAPPRRRDAIRDAEGPTDPILEAFVARCRDRAETNVVCGEILDVIAANWGEATVDPAWQHALKTFGDPMLDQAVTRKFVTYLYNRSKKGKS